MRFFVNDFVQGTYISLLRVLLVRDCLAAGRDTSKPSTVKTRGFMVSQNGSCAEDVSIIHYAGQAYPV